VFIEFRLAPTQIDVFCRIQDIAAEVGTRDTIVIPSVGPDYGKMMDQAEILKDMDFPTAMVLPLSFPGTAEGAVTGVRNFARVFGKKVIVYVKSEDIYTPPALAELVNEGLVVAIKYAVVREDPTDDAFLSELCTLVDPKVGIA
jgi:hypothetical protein